MMGKQQLGLILGIISIIVVVFPCVRFRFFKRMAKKASSVISDQLSIVVGEYSAIGKRPTMEDHTLTRLDGQKVALLGVFDGHCGQQTSLAASLDLPSFLDENQCTDNPNETCQALCECFLRFDKTTQQQNSGSTACMALINKKNQLYVANAGDTRAVLVRNCKAIAMSVDHKPSRETERLRIQLAHGEVRPTQVMQYGCLLAVGPPRVWPGGLSVSRGLGDFAMKDYQKLKVMYQMYRAQLGEDVDDLPRLPDNQQAMVSNYPEVHYCDLSAGCQALVIACDGLFDVMTAQDVSRIVSQYLPRFMVKALEQVALKNVDKLVQSPVEVQSLVMQTIKYLQYQFAKVKFSVRHEFLNFQMGSELLLQADFLCAQMLAEKLVSIALQRDTTDNVTCQVCLFRWPTTDKTASQWRRYAPEVSLFKKVKKALFREISSAEEMEASDGDAEKFQVQVWRSPEDPSFQFYEK